MDAPHFEREFRRFSEVVYPGLRGRPRVGSLQAEAPTASALNPGCFVVAGERHWDGGHPRARNLRN